MSVVVVAVVVFIVVVIIIAAIAFVGLVVAAVFRGGGGPEEWRSYPGQTPAASYQPDQLFNNQRQARRAFPLPTHTRGLPHLHPDQLVAPDVHVSDLVVHDGGQVEGGDLLLLVGQVLEAEERAVQLVVRQRVARLLKAGGRASGQVGADKGATLRGGGSGQISVT